MHSYSVEKDATYLLSALPMTVEFDTPRVTNVHLKVTSGDGKVLLNVDLQTVLYDSWTMTIPDIYNLRISGSKAPTS